MMQFYETLHDDYGQLFSVDRVLCRAATAHQDVVIFDNATFGRVLAIDGVIQTTEGDNHVYHEMLAHVPIIGHGAVEHVLIVGGGDGGCLREVVKHDVAGVTMVDLDRGVIELAKTYMPGLSDGAFDDPRLELIIGDGNAFVHDTDRRFDVIIVDSTDPIGPGEILFSRPFYAACRRCLTSGGVLVAQNGVPTVQENVVRESHIHLRALFANATVYLVPVPSYTGGALAVGWASDDADLRRKGAGEFRARAAAIETRYYSPDIHAAAFVLPPELQALLN